MKTRSFFIMALLCLLFSSNSGLAQQLNQKISLQVKDATLSQVLSKIQKKYAIRFAYLNNSLPAKQLFSAEIKDKTLAEVLDVLLEKTDIGYLEKNGQIIIKKGLPKSTPKATTFKKLPPAAPETKPASKSSTVTETKVTTTVKPDGTVANKIETKTEVKPAPPEATETEALKNNPVTENTAPNQTPETQINPDTAQVKEDKSVTIKFKNIFTKKDKEADTTEIKPYHFGIIYPLSTHGIYANNYVNRVSGHLLVGTAAGLQGFEFSGVGNVEQKYVHGVQLAGVFNIARNKNNDSNLSLKGGQVAGVINVAAGNSDGTQIAGVVNVAQNIDGAQISGFLNKARYVRGTQIGLINIADSMAGVPIGLISIIKKNGYRRLEAYYADDFDANLTYKIGVNKFYNIIGLGAELKGAQRWGLGVGFGSEWKLTNWFHVNTDALCYYVVEESYESFPSGLFGNAERNLLNKFRLLGTLYLGKRFALFGGPVYNVYVTKATIELQMPPKSQLYNNSFFNRTSANGTNVKMWIGFNAGIRF